MGNSRTRHAPTGKGGRSSLRSRTRSDAPSIGILPKSPLHYFMFCSTLNLTDDWTLANQSQEGANVQQALFAAHLATGSTLHCRSIKSANINCYLVDVVKFIGQYQEVDPRFTSSADTKLAPIIAKVLQEQRRWEVVPNRREPFTMSLQLILSKKAASAPHTCSFDAAIANWTLCNMYARCRGVEWAQTYDPRTPRSLPSQSLLTRLRLHLSRCPMPVLEPRPNFYCPSSISPHPCQPN
jgi:hypothetical protein